MAVVVRMFDVMRSSMLGSSSLVDGGMGEKSK